MSIIFQLFSAKDLKNLSEDDLKKFKGIIRAAAQADKSPTSVKDAPNRRLRRVLWEAKTAQTALEGDRDKARTARDGAQKVLEEKAKLADWADLEVKEAVRRAALEAWKKTQQDVEKAQEALKDAQKGVEEAKKKVQKAERQLENYQRDITDTCRSRAREVFQQLTSQLPGDPPGPDKLDLPSLDLSRGSEDDIWEEFRKKLLNSNDLKRLDELGGSRNEILNFAVTCDIDNFNFYNALRFVKESVLETPGSPFQGQRLKDPDTRYSLFNPGHPLYGSS